MMKLFLSFSKAKFFSIAQRRRKILTQLKDENSLNLNHKVDGQRIHQAVGYYFSHPSD